MCPRAKIPCLMLFASVAKLLDSRNCNGHEICDRNSGLCLPDPVDNLPCGTETLCIEERYGYTCGCETLSAKECANWEPYCRPPDQNGKIKCVTNETYPAGPENTTEACSDGVDNDFNGLKDCEDPGCFDICSSEATTSSTQAVPTTTTTTTSGFTTSSTTTTSTSELYFLYLLSNQLGLLHYLT